MTAGRRTVIIADDHPLLGVALRLDVQRVAPDANVVEVHSFAALREAAVRHPDASLVLLDLMMPDVEGLSALQFLTEAFPALRVAIISALEEHCWVRSAEALGAVAYLPKSTRHDRVQEVLQILLEGGSWWPDAPQAAAAAAHREPTLDERLERLSRQELRILLRIRDGRLNKQIADELGIAESTVKTHITMLLRKLDLQSRTQAAVVAQRLLSRPSPHFTTEPRATKT
ncbi:MAG: response regulator transcription factor [Pseudomonadota bacterium]